jgi:muramoyltetrapeptide carboxypeptidase
VPAQRLDAGAALLARRYRVRLADHVRGRQGYLAADDDARADDFNRALRDPEVRAIVMARGGYGAMRILDRLDADALRRDPKLLVGFSDATAILCWALRCAGVRGVHGPMVAQLAELPASDVAWLHRVMEQPGPLGEWPAPLRALDHGVASAQVGVVQGTLAGGNLCLLAHLAGTPYGLAVPELVLLLEEVGERPYRIDRLLTQLGLSGIMDAARAAVLGEFKECRETVHDDHPSATAVVAERLRRYRLPALLDAPLAHGARNLALPMGVRCAVDIRVGRLTLLGSAVA